MEIKWINNADLFSQPSLIKFTKGMNNFEHNCMFSAALNVLISWQCYLSFTSWKKYIYCSLFQQVIPTILFLCVHLWCGLPYSYIIRAVNLKLQSVSFASLSPSLFENLDLQLCAEYLPCVGLWVGMAPAGMNLMFWGECVAVTHRTSVDTAT